MDFAQFYVNVLVSLDSQEQVGPWKNGREFEKAAARADAKYKALPYGS